MLTVLTAAAVLVADQATKAWIRGTFQEHEVVAVLRDCLNITFVRNRGGVFGIFPERQSLFLILSIATIAAIAYFHRSYAGRGAVWRASVGLILGGAVGNLLDRLFMDPDGCVTDWIDVYWGRYHWPAFNIADAAITVGVGILVCLLLSAPDARAGGPAPS
ncbi:MAG: signal peptidase II [bacterium]|nr:signal peptidase II [bacterium]